MLRTSWSKFWSAQASCGRQLDSNGLPTRSISSPRAGDISSMICGSVIWPKKVIVFRLPARPFCGFARFFLTSVASPPPVLSVAYGDPPSKSMVSSSVSLPAGSATATALAMSMATIAHSAIGEMRRVKTSS